jgi:hypothetical protein
MVTQLSSVVVVSGLRFVLDMCMASSLETKLQPAGVVHVLLLPFMLLLGIATAFVSVWLLHLTVAAFSNAGIIVPLGAFPTPETSLRCMR